MTNTDYPRRKGSKGERRAVQFLKQLGYRILNRNFYCYQGELDIVCLDGNYVVFVEVKQRRPNSYVTPEESITRDKKRRIITCAKRWIVKNNYKGDARFDVITIADEKITHYRNAFEAF